MGAIIASFARRAWHILVLLALTLAIAAPTASLAQSGRLLQLSTRDQVLTGDDVMIGGFVIGGSANKTVAIVATGPSLSAYGVVNPLGDPVMRLVRSSDHAVIATNDNWQSAANAAQLVAAGLQPAHPQEAAILINLQPGAYTAIVEGVGGGTGVAVIAVYEVDHPEAPLINMSTRARVLTGENVMISGFVVGPTDPNPVVVTVAGPSLAGLVQNPLQNPTLALVRMSDRTTIATNDDWQVQANPGDVAALQANGLQPSDPREPAIIATLQPGLYTAIATGVGNTTGVAVMSVYQALRGVSITSANNTAFTVGTAGTFTITTNATPSATSITTTPLPAGLSLSATSGAGTATISGTPTGPGGTFTITITASNGGVTPNGTQSFTLTVNQAPAITSANAATFQLGTAGTHTVVATGFPAPTLSVSGALPAGVTFNPATGALSGMPTVGGSFPLVFTAANGIGANATQNFTLTVNQTVAITSANAATFTVGTAGTFTITTSATPAATLITVTGALPAGVTLGATSGTGTAVLSGTPGAGTGGTYTVTITASNGGVTPNGTQSFTLTVNQAPAITSAASAIFQVGSPNTHTVVATGFPAPTLSVTGALPAGVTFNATTGVLSGTPTVPGTFPLVFTAANGVGTDATQNFTLTVNQTVTITSANATTFQVGSAGTFTITTSATPTASLITITGALPAGVTLGATSGTGTAVLSGTPAAATGGTYVVTITASNGGVTPNGTQTFTLTVGQAPIITSGNTATFTVGTAGSFAVTSTGFPAATYAVAVGTLPSGVTLNPTTGALSGTPAAGTGGSYPFTITASNGFAPDAAQSFTLTVNQAPTITSAAATTFTVGAPGTFNVVATGFPAAMTFTTASVLPTGVTLSAGGVLSGTPAAGTGGSYPITITASNGVAPAGTQGFTLTVNQAPAISSGNAVTFNVGTPGTFTVTTTGFPTGAAMVIGESGALPTGITFVDNNDGTATLSGTPAAGTAAGSPYALTITANNGVAPPASQPFTLTLTDAAVAVADAFNVVHDSGVNSFAAPGVLANDLGTPAPTVFSVTGLTTCSAFPCTVATTHGSITVQANGAFTYTPTVNYAGPDTFTYIATNAGGNSAPATVTITVTNALTVLDLNGGVAGIDFATTFTEGGGPVAIVDPAQLTVSDADDTQLTGATIVIANLQDGLSESLGFTCTGVSPVCEGAIPVAAVTYTAATGTLEILATAPLADFQKLLRTITYVNAAVAPTGATRDVTFTVNDGNDDNLPIAHSIVTISGVNQAPTITAPATASTPVNTALVFSGTVSVADQDAGTADVTMTLTATNGTVTLTALGGLTTVTGNATANVVATAPLANLNAALNGASFNPTAAFSGAATLTINANDNGNTGAGGPLSAVPKTINITVATSPTFTSVAATTFTIGQAGTFTVTTSATPPVTAIARTGAALPTGVTYLDNGNGTATLSGTPAVATEGGYALIFTATNGTPPDAVQNPFTLTIVKQAQTISFTSTAPASPVVGGATYNVTATASSGLVVSFAIDPSAAGVCTIAGSTVSFIGAGTCVINANQAGNGTFAAAPQVQQSFVVGQGAQTISFTSVAPVAAVFGGPTYNVTATATSGLPVAFTIDATAASVCSIAGSTVSFIGVGTCVINANQAGNANYTAAPQVQQSFAVGKASQTISFTSVAPATATVGGSTYNVTATATSGLPVTFTIDAAAAAVCSIAGSTVSFIGNGTCVIDANQAGNANYNAAPQVQQSFTVKSAQSITFTSTPPATPTVGGATYNVTATATSALPVAFTIDPSASTVCSIAGSTVSFGPNDGTCVINANQAGNASFYAAPQVQQSFTVKKSNTITFTSTAPTAAVFNGPTYNVTATATSGLTVTLTIDATAVGVCSIAGSTVSFIGTGTCVINANQAGNASFYPAPQVQQSFTVGPNLVGDSYAVVGNTQLVAAAHSAPTTPFTTDPTTILANDTSNVAITLTTVTNAATTGGGLITIDSLGKFTYTPPVGQSSGTDTYVYTGASTGVSRTATITFNIANVVWYVNQAAAAGNGRSNTPFNTLNAADAPSAANSFIYVHTGAGTTTGNLTMDTNQELHGQGVAFTLDALSIPAGARPTLSGSVTLADDTVITGVNFAGGAGAAISGPAITANNPILIDQVNVTGYANALSLTAMNGTGGITFSNAAISNATGAEVLISGGNIPVNFPASTSISGNALRLIDIQGRTGGAVTFAGALTDTGTGIFLNNNAASTFSFTGGMTLNGATTTFTATNPGPAVTGSVVVTGTNRIGNTTSTSATALNVANIAIAAGGLNFVSIASGGGTSNGITLDNTGATAGLTVLGDGANASVGGNGSGGTIANKSGANGNRTQGIGVYLNKTKNVVLRRMIINGTNQNFGIRGFLVDGFTLEYSTIGGAGVGNAAGTNNNAFPDDSGEGTIYFGNTTTTGISTQGTFTNNNISGGAWDNMHVENTVAGTTTLTIKGNTFGSNQAGTGNTSLLVIARNAGTTINSVVGGPIAGEANTFTGAVADLANFTGQTATTMDVQFRNNVMSNNHAGNVVGGGNLTLASQGVMTFVVDGNSMRDADGSTMTLFKASAGTSFTGKVSNNTLGVTGVAASASKSGNGMFLSAAGTGTIGLTIVNNQIRNWKGNAAMFFDNTGGSYTANFTITGNTMAEPGTGSFSTLALTNGGNLTTDTVNVCAVIGGAGALKNTFSGAPGFSEVYLGSSGQNGGHTFNLPGYVGASNLANVATFVTGNNTFALGATVQPYDDNGGAGSFTGIGVSCPTPP